ncbi:MAG: AAA family ATPase, partial [Chloroflexota bacterium]
MSFACQQCGLESLKWYGRCPQCGYWNSLVEKVTSVAGRNPPRELSSLSPEVCQRLDLPLKELNRVLGGGLVAGSLVLLAGEPGIGKSTLLLQVADLVAGENGSVVY